MMAEEFLGVVAGFLGIMTKAFATADPNPSKDGDNILLFAVVEYQKKCQSLDPYKGQSDE